MAQARETQRVERVTVTLLPDTDERGMLQVPSTFNTAARAYVWRHSERLDYMIVPTRISNVEIRVDLFLSASRRGRPSGRDLQKVIQEFVKDKIASEWRGLRLGSIGRPTFAQPPTKTYLRGTIEEMLGTVLEG